MSLLVRQSERFEIDVRLQANWYLDQAAFTAAKDFAQAVESTLALLATQPFIGPECDYPEPELAGLRIFLVKRPFQRFLIFYRATGTELHALRVVEGHRDLPRRLLDPPGAESACGKRCRFAPSPRKFGADGLRCQPSLKAPATGRHRSAMEAAEAAQK